MVPRTDTDELESRPLELKASDMDVLVEFNPDGKVNTLCYLYYLCVLTILQQQMVLTLAVMDLAIINTDKQRRPQSFLNITSPRGLVCFFSPVSDFRFCFSDLSDIHSEAGGQVAILYSDDYRSQHEGNPDKTHFVGCHLHLLWGSTLDR